MFNGLRKAILLVVLSIVWIAGPAQATWTKHTIVTGAADWNGMRSVYADDIDGDGDNDVMAAARYANKIVWFENTPGGFVQHMLSDTFEGSWDVNSCDVDGDGDKDILGAALSAWDLAVWINNGTPTGWEQYIVDSNCAYTKSVYGTDLDNDGDGDVIGASFSGDYMNWIENQGAGNWDENLLQNNFQGARDIYTLDFDHDGDQDILGAGDNTGAAIWWNQGNNNFSYELIRNFYGIRSIHAADITGDGTAEVIAASSYFNAIVYWEQVDTGWVETVVSDGVDFANSAYGADIDRDGDVDIVGGAYDSDLVIWWEQDQGAWIQHIVAIGVDGVRTVFASDMDGDGDKDILAAASHTGDLSWYENVIAFTALTLDIIPHEPIFMLPSTGGTLSFDAILANNTDQLQNGQAWTEVRLPDGTYYGPIVQTFINLPPFASVNLTGLSQLIPGYAPNGDYQFLVKMGALDTYRVAASDSFAFRKLDTLESFTEGSATNFETGSSGQDYLVGLTPIPDDFGVKTAYPNPFNPSTTIELSLPQTANVVVTVTNVNGRHVATLADGSFQAGYHSLTFNAQGMASGLYFIHTIVPGQMNEMQKVMLVR
jgi:FG-GAP-like repeat/Secretion system C-terminal sorting domain